MGFLISRNVYVLNWRKTNLCILLSKDKAVFSSDVVK